MRTHSDFKEGTAEGWPAWNDSQEVGFALLYCEATVLIVGGDDVLQTKRKILNGQPFN